MLIIALIATTKESAQVPARIQEPSRRIPRRGGFTLLETIIVIAMIALLVSLLAPSLAGARTAAQRTTSLAQMRSHASVISTYGMDWNDSLPYFTDPAATKTILRREELVLSLSYFDAHFAWNIALADGYYDGQWRQGSFFAPTQWRGASRFTDYYYPCAFIARPEYWRTPARRTDRSQLRPTRLTEVHFPSRKSLLVARWPLEQMAEKDGMLGQPWHSTDFAAVDGSSRGYRLSDVRRGEPSGDGPDAPGAFHLLDFPPAMHTYGGVHGWDFQ